MKLSDLPDLRSEIGIDAASLTKRLAFLSFNEKDKNALAQLHRVLADHRTHIIASFYDHLLGFPELFPLLGDEAKLDRLRHAQAEYFDQLTSGPHDLAYVENRLRIGIVHQHIGLTPQWYLNAFCKYLSEALPLITGHYANDPEQSKSACAALLKVVFFDMGLALDTYFHSEHQSLLQERSYTEQIVSSMPIGLVVLDSNRNIHLANQAVLRMFDLSNPDWEGKTLGSLLGVTQLDSLIDQVLRSGTNSHEHGFELENIRGRRSFLSDITLAKMGKAQVVLFMVQDITLRKQSEEEIRRLAFYDPLTHLPNRRLLQERLLQSMSASARSGKHCALMFIDLDNFKVLNDTQGHAVGDQLLKEVARRLKHNLRKSDTVARLGGDEFVVVVDSLSGITQEAGLHSEMIAEKIRTALGQTYHLDGIEYHSSPSIGVCLFRGQQYNLEEILKQADIAMYQAKTSGRNKISFFDPLIQKEMEDRAALEKDLRSSIPMQQLVLHYQAQVNETGNIIGAEALIRWHHPQWGMVPPGKFIPLAEENGMILSIGDWVIEQACSQLKQWESDPVLRELELSINISPRQLSQPNFVEQVKNAILESGIRTSQLKLELTESFILNDIDKAIQKMQELRHIGIRFAMDDFGTGYSSLAYLTRLPLQQVKIDQSFVRGITDNKHSSVMVRTIIGIVDNFDMDTVAEGVETDEQFAFLRQYGCKQFQGYYFGKPVPLREFEARCLDEVLR